MLTTCVDNFLDNKEAQHSFFVVSGPQNIGKSSIVQEIARDRIGQYFYHDFLWIRDLSDITGKKHSLKIETPRDKEDRFIALNDKESYEDIGIREVNNRLQQAPLGKFKILLIENIERIVPAAANAFLKNLEEPLPNRLIIATVSHQSQLLDTIISRALVVRFQSVSQTDLLAFAKANTLFNDDPEFQTFACSMAMGRPGVLVNLYTHLSQNEELQKNFQSLVKLLSKDGFVFQKQNILKQLHES
jgi:replication-associated recombination protein RarA